jgi:hypothetical protein
MRVLRNCHAATVSPDGTWIQNIEFLLEPKLPLIQYQRYSANDLAYVEHVQRYLMEGPWQREIRRSSYFRTSGVAHSPGAKSLWTSCKTQH